MYNLLMGKAIRKSCFRFAILVSVSLSALAAFCVESAKTVDAWRTAVDKPAADRAHIAYTSNVVRCEWAGENPRVASLMPANVAFNFAVIGDPNSASRVTKTLEETAAAIDPALRKTLEQYGLLNSTLQWLVRSCRPGVTNSMTYLAVKNHPAAFREQDFDVAKLKAVAASLTGKTIALPVQVKVEYLDDPVPLSKAEPCIDYPDVMPEETFSNPFGTAIVLRAPERKRRFRLSASTYPFAGRALSYEWRTTGGVALRPWPTTLAEVLKNGFAEVTVDAAYCGTRADILVFAQSANGIYGPPAIVSVYNPPLAKRTYVKGKLQSISYLKESKNVPYDIGPIWAPREWRDDFALSGKGRIVSFTRTIPGSFTEEPFSAIGELVLSMSSSGIPLVTRKVEYFISPETGALGYRPVGEEKKYRLGESPFRRSGE
jgi:hypothetical protein